MNLDSKWLSLMVVGIMFAASIVDVSKNLADSQRTAAHVCAEQTIMTPFCDGLLKDMRK